MAKFIDVWGCEQSELTETEFILGSNQKKPLHFKVVDKAPSPAWRIWNIEKLPENLVPMFRPDPNYPDDWHVDMNTICVAKSKHQELLRMAASIGVSNTDCAKECMKEEHITNEKKIIREALPYFKEIGL